LVKNRCRFTAADLKAFFQFFSSIFFTLTLATIFISASFLPKVSKRLKVEFWSSEMIKIGRGQQKLTPLSPPPSEFCNHEKNNVIRSAMDALRNSKINLPPSCSHSLFIHIFHFDFGCTSYGTFRRKVLAKLIRKKLEN
jgi:hypothetical protein